MQIRCPQVCVSSWNARERNDGADQRACQSTFSHLPAVLVKQTGLSKTFQNKCIRHPSSVMTALPIFPCCLQQNCSWPAPSRKSKARFPRPVHTDLYAHDKIFQWYEYSRLLKLFMNLVLMTQSVSSVMELLPSIFGPQTWTAKAEQKQVFCY